MLIKVHLPRCVPFYTAPNHYLISANGFPKQIKRELFLDNLQISELLLWKGLTRPREIAEKIDNSITHRIKPDNEPTSWRCANLNSQDAVIFTAVSIWLLPCNDSLHCSSPCLTTNVNGDRVKTLRTSAYLALIVIRTLSIIYFQILRLISISAESGLKHVIAHMNSWTWKE